MPDVERTTARYVIGDVFDVMATIPDGSVDLVLTSPPFLALRSYLPEGHPDKAKEIGSEPTPAAFLDTLLALSAEWRRVLAPHGSICVELGDTYSGSGGENHLYEGSNPAKGFHGSSNHGALPGQRRQSAGWPLAKSLCGIPTLYAWSLAYGRNLLTGQPSPAGMWRIRNLVAWCRPNPPVGALGDKFRPGTSYLTMACISGSRYFDLDAVRETVQHPDATHTPGVTGRQPGNTERYRGALVNNPAGAPPLDWWEIPTQPFRGSHYATFPAALCTRPILAMCPPKVCTTCGKPSERIIEVTKRAASNRAELMHSKKARPDGSQWREEIEMVKETTTLGWSDCGHNAWRPGLVLDCFGGSGTTGAVATGHGRDCLLIDLDERNADLAQQRIGMFLTVEHFSKEGAA